MKRLLSLYTGGMEVFILAGTDGDVLVVSPLKLSDCSAQRMARAVLSDRTGYVGYRDPLSCWLIVFVSYIVDISLVLYAIHLQR